MARHAAIGKLLSICLGLAAAAGGCWYQLYDGPPLVPERVASVRVKDALTDLRSVNGERCCSRGAEVLPGRYELEVGIRHWLLFCITTHTETLQVRLDRGNTYEISRTGREIAFDRKPSVGSPGSAGPPIPAERHVRGADGPGVRRPERVLVFEGIEGGTRIGDSDPYLPKNDDHLRAFGLGVGFGAGAIRRGRLKLTAHCRMLGSIAPGPWPSEIQLRAERLFGEIGRGQFGLTLYFIPFARANTIAGNSVVGKAWSMGIGGGIEAAYYWRLATTGPGLLLGRLGTRYSGVDYHSVTDGGTTVPGTETGTSFDFFVGIENRY